ncbi:MAG: hypothetical protein P8103_10150 [Candidatus Thiodiazotropha sp.]
MKGYPQPLSEAFVYSSPERPVGGSFRWVSPRTAPVRGQRRQHREVPHGRRDPR